MNAFQFLTVFVSFIVTFLGLVLALHIFPKLKLMDRPHEYGLTRAPIPYSAGIIFFIVFLLTIFLFVDITKPIAGVIFAGLLITFVSFIDDRIRLSPVLRLGAQILAGIIVVLAGVKIQVLNNPFGGALRLDTISFDFAGQSIWLFSTLAIIAWLVLMMNVMNWLDGIPGLASGVSTIAQVSIFVLASSKFNATDQSAVIAISSALAAASFAFLLFDFPSPKLLMGDSGSMFLGFMLGALSILAGGKLATALLIMGFPILDALWVILRRILSGKSPFRGDYSHFHHRLLQVGLSPKKALIFNYILCIAFAAIALTLHTTYAKFLAFLSVFLLMVLVGIAMRIVKA